MAMDRSDSADDAPSPPDEGLASWSARTARTAGPGAGERGPCPDPSLLAGFAEGRLLDAERQALQGHLALCEPCRAAVAGWIRDRGDPSLAPPAPAPRVLRGWRVAVPIAAAAALLLAFLLPAGVLRHPGADGGTDMASAARDLAAARPDLFAGFRPVEAGEELPRAFAQKRGAVVLLAPAGTILETRPAFRWRGVPGIARWKVTLLAADGEVLGSAEAADTALPFPAGTPDLAAGKRYLWEASGEGPLGPVKVRRAFDVAPEPDRRAFADAVAVIRERVPERLRSLVAAHLALRRGYYAAAEEEAAGHLRRFPGDPAGLDALGRARRALGEPAAEDGR